MLTAGVAVGAVHVSFAEHDHVTKAGEMPPINFFLQNLDHKFLAGFGNVTRSSQWSENPSTSPALQKKEWIQRPTQQPTQTKYTHLQENPTLRSYLTGPLAVKHKKLSETCETFKRRCGKKGGGACESNQVKLMGGVQRRHGDEENQSKPDL